MTSCTTINNKSVPVQFYKIKAHYIEKGEPAPFDGILLNQYTFDSLKNQLKECKKIVRGK